MTQQKVGDEKLERKKTKNLRREFISLKGC